MKKIIPILLLATLCCTAESSFARGGFSSGGRGGFSSGRSFSSPSRSFSSSSRSTSTPRTTRTVTRSTTVSRSYGNPGYYGSYGHPMMMGGFGMGYGYSNGMLTGLILGNLMHPQGTTVYQGGGYGGQALLYPDGRVVDQNGYQVGTYANGQFTAQQGGMVAQPAPPPVQAEPVTVVEAGPSGWEIAAGIVIGLLVIIIIIAAIAA